MICPYGSAWIGMLASIVDTTNLEKILKLTGNATDFFGNRSFPTYLIFKPFYEPRTVKLEVGKNSVNVYDLVSKQFLKNNVVGTIDLRINEDAAVTIMLIPANLKTSIKGSKLMAGNTIIDYRYK